MLDAAAKAAYRQRLDDLREELEEATSLDDHERAASAREEMDLLAAELPGPSDSVAEIVEPPRPASGRG